MTAEYYMIGVSMQHGRRTRSIRGQHPSILALTAALSLALPATGQDWAGDAAKIPDATVSHRNVLAHRGVPAAAEDWSFAPFSDKTPTEFDISEHVVAGTNTLALRIFHWSSLATPANSNRIAFRIAT